MRVLVVGTVLQRLNGQARCPHHMDRATEADGGWGLCSYSWGKEAGPGLQPRF